jgi:hypothetical protein
MSITINGSGTITGISSGGLPDGIITTDDLANNAVTAAKIGTTEQSRLCAAWVNFNGTGTVAIRASYNVSSITDNGTGDYTVNFTTAMADANYSFAGMAQYDTTGGGDRRIGVSRTASAIASGSARINTLDGSGSNADFLVVAFVVFR